MIEPRVPVVPRGFAWRLACVAAAVLASCSPMESPRVSGSTAPGEATGALAEGTSRPTVEPALIGAASGRDPLLPTLGNGGYDVQLYDLDVETNPIDDQTRLRVTIEAIATQRLGRFSLDYSGIVPRSVRVDDADVTFAESDGKLTVTPAGPIALGDAFRTSIEIVGRPIAVRGTGWVWRGPEQLSAFGIYDILPTWLPMNADPADKALIETHLTVPRPYTAVGPGVLASVVDVADGRRFNWRAGPSSQVSIVVRDYRVVDLGSVAGTPLTSYEPGDLAARQRDALMQIPTIFEQLAKLYGPFPFESLSVVWVDGLTDMEGPDEGLLKWGPQRLEPTALAHHLTHIWFTVNVTPSTSRESFLRAAFANYADVLWIEHASGPAARDERLESMYARLGSRTEPPADPSRLADNEALYIRGPLALHALRVIVGDDAFFEILRGWVARYGRQAAAVADFVELAEQVSGRSLATWKQRWLLDEDVPPKSELALGSA